MKDFRFSNWERGTDLFPKKFFYDISLERDWKRHSGKRFNFVVFYLRDRPEVGESWKFGKHYIGINTYICWLIQFSIYR